MKKYLLILAFIVLGFASKAEAVWYSSSWGYCQKITINSSKVSTTTTAFPVVATSTQNVLRTATNGGHTQKDDGSDIIFTDGTDCTTDGGTLLNYERELYASTTGQIVFWIETPVSSTANEYVLMYYGNSSATDQATTTGVWDKDLNADGVKDFLGVWHIAEDGNGTAGEYKDSSVNPANCQGGSGTANQVPGRIAGPLGWAGNFDGSARPPTGSPDHIDCSNPSKLNITGKISMEVVQSRDTTSSYGQTIYKGDSIGSNYQYFYQMNNSVTVWIQSFGNSQTFNSSSNLPSGINYLFSTWDGTTSGNNVGIYLNGALDVARAKSGTTGSNTQIFTIGSLSAPGLYNAFDGMIDEVRIHSYNRSAEWITTNYNTTYDVSTFLTIGAEETQTTTTVSIKIPDLPILFIQ